MARLRFAHAVTCIVLSLPAAGCGSDDTGEDPLAGDETVAPQPLPPLASAPLTTERTFVPTHAVSKDAALNPQIVADLATMLEQGYGEVTLGGGQPIVPHTLDGSEPPAMGSGAKLVARFVHLADTQLADDESPARLAAYDSPGLTSGAFRPQEGHECRVLRAAVRTINAVHEVTPISFVLLGGDNADNAQANEIDWFQAILDGAPSVECDSGLDDDPVPGPDNDPKDLFFAEGLAVPWRWVTGNHDILAQGNFPVAEYAEKAIGTYAPNGTRDYRQPGAPVVKDEVPADPRREMLERGALLDRIAGAGDGHGIDAATKAYGKAYYTFDVEGTPLRIIVLDSAAETGGAQGVIHQADVDAFIAPALDEAKAAGKWVILTSHHASAQLSDGSGLGGEKQDDAITPEQWVALLGQYDNVLMHLAGHTHVHRVTPMRPEGAHAYWEVETSALADYPHQMRVIEVWDADDGFVAIRAVALDYAVDDDPVAAEGRKLGVVDYTSGWEVNGAAGDPDHRNVELWIAKP